MHILVFFIQHNTRQEKVLNHELFDLHLTYLLFCKLWDKCLDVFLVRIKMLVDLPIKMFVQSSEQIWITTKQPGRERQHRARLPSRKLRRVACDFEVPAMFANADFLFQLSLKKTPCSDLDKHCNICIRNLPCF